MKSLTTLWRKFACAQLGLANHRFVRPIPPVGYPFYPLNALPPGRVSGELCLSPRWYNLVLWIVRSSSPSRATDLATFKLECHRCALFLPRSNCWLIRGRSNSWLRRRLPSTCPSCPSSRSRVDGPWVYRRCHQCVDARGNVMALDCLPYGCILRVCGARATTCWVEK